MANEYEISRGTGKCAATGKDFKEQDYYYAALFETEEGFERKDYSIEAWSGPPENCFCFWKGRVPPREKKPATIAVDNSILTNLFCRLEDDSSESRQKFRFVLALLLMRKRLLRFEKAVQKDGCEYWQVRLSGEQSSQQVLNPNLTDAEIERLSAQLTAILSGNASAISELEEEESGDTGHETRPDDEARTSSEADPSDVQSEAAASARQTDNQESVNSSTEPA